MEKPLKLTKKAIAKIKEEARVKGILLTEIYLRVGIKTASCCGFEYLLEFTKEKLPDDQEHRVDEIRIIIDRDSYKGLEDAELDYVVAADLQKTGFTFKNPNEKKTCGCGRTHSTKEAG